MSAILDALTYLGESAAKPGRAVRGGIAGRPDELLAFLPFSDSLGVTDPSRAVWGRDLLGMAGLGTGSETGDVVAGIGVDLLTDPLLYFGGGLVRGAMGGLRGARALGVGAGEDAGAAIGRLARPGAPEAGAIDDLIRQADELLPPPSRYDDPALAGEVFEINPALQAADDLLPPPQLAQSAEDLFGFPFSGNAADPYGPGSVFHDMMLEGAHPLQRQAAITSAWDDALQRVPGRPLPQMYYPMTPEGYAAIDDAAAVRGAWEDAFQTPLAARQAEIAAFEDAARAGLYGDAPGLQALLDALGGQKMAVAGITENFGVPVGIRTAVEMAQDMAYLPGSPLADIRRPILGVGDILAGEAHPATIGLVANDAGKFMSNDRRALKALLDSPSLGPDVAAAKRLAGNTQADAARRAIISDAEELRRGVYYDDAGHELLATPERQRELAIDMLHRLTDPYSVAFTKGAVRGDDAVGPLLREIYGFAGQTPPKWVLPKPPPPLAPLPEMPTGPAPLTSERAAQLLPRGYEAPRVPAGLTEADIPTPAQVGLPLDHPDYRFAWLREAQKNAARRRNVYQFGA